MIKVSVFYPDIAGARFDMTYYMQTHTPMVRTLLEPALKGLTIDQGLSGGTPGTAMTYLIIAELLFNSVEEFQAAFEQHATEIVADIPKYTNIQPILQISEVKL